MAYSYHCMTNAESQEKEGGFLIEIRGLGSFITSSKPVVPPTAKCLKTHPS